MSLQHQAELPLTSPQASSAVITEPPVWFITGCSTGFGFFAATAGSLRAAVRESSGKQRGHPVRPAPTFLKTKPPAAIDPPAGRDA